MPNSEYNLDLAQAIVAVMNGSYVVGDKFIENVRMGLFIDEVWLLENDETLLPLVLDVSMTEQRYKVVQ